MGVLSGRVGSGTSGLGRGSATTGRTFTTGSAAAFAPTGQLDEPTTTGPARPFRDIGKQNLQLTPSPPVTPLGMEPAKPFSGVPVLGALFEGLNAVGSLPVGGILK